MNAHQRIVVKLSGTPVNEPGACPGLWDALFDAAAQSEIVIVHGGGRAVDHRLAELGLNTTRRDGLRVTPREHIGPVTGVLAGEVNTALVGVLIAAGVRAVGVGLSAGGLCACSAIEGLGRVGRVDAGNGDVIAALLRASFVPVVHSIGLDDAGEPLNVNADDAAAGIAAAITADRLVLLTDVDGVMNADGGLVRSLDVASADALIADGVAREGMVPKLRAACAAAGTTGEALIGSWHRAAELISGGGQGTRIIAGESSLRRRPKEPCSTQPDA